MKKKCDRYPALEEGKEKGSCSLGYKIKSYYIHNIRYYKPLEDCPKPRTLTEYIKLRKQLWESLQ